MKILVIGFGSIGKRHFKNLQSVPGAEVFVYDPDQTKTEGIKRILSLDRQSLAGFNVAFVCNPTSEHLKTAIICAGLGMDIFVEKPVSSTMKDLKKLEKIVVRKKLVTMVGCNMRFHPCLVFIKKYLEGGKLGRVYSIWNDFGYYLPSWRPNEDYRKNYASKKKTGGGIILDDIHEFDLLFWLNGWEKVVRGKIISNRVSNLEIETEDQVVGVFEFKNKVLGMVTSDYLSRGYRRSCRIVGESGTLTWDWNENKVRLITGKGNEEIFGSVDFKTDDMYIEELKYFMKKVELRENTENDISRAGKTLGLLLKK